MSEEPRTRRTDLEERDLDAETTSAAKPEPGIGADSGPGAEAEFAADMGIEFLGLVDGATTLQLELSQKHMSRANRAHGGVLFTLLDSALGRSILNHLPPGRGCATVEIKVNYFRPVQRGRITARAWKRELTRSLGYAEGEILNEEGKVLARASGTFFLTETLRQEDRERV